MNNKLKNTAARCVILIAAALLATVTMASAADYEFKVVNAQVAGQAPTIELIDTTTGQAVAGADIEVVHTVYVSHVKGGLSLQRVFVPLQTHLSGKCKYLNGKSPTRGDLTLMARVPGKFWSVWGTVDLGN